jgi:hypothetical protein
MSKPNRRIHQGKLFSRDRSLVSRITTGRLFTSMDTETDAPPWQDPPTPPATDPDLTRRLPPRPSQEKRPLSTLAPEKRASGAL